MKYLEILLNNIKKDKTGIIGVLIIIFILLYGILGSIFIMNLNIFDSIYYTIITIATVGYGDMIPTSPAGRFVGLILLIAGVVMFSIVTASFSHIFTEKVFKRDNEEFNQKMNMVRDNMIETKSSIDEIRKKTISNEEELAEMKETINNLSQQMDYLIDIIEKKE